MEENSLLYKLVKYLSDTQLLGVIVGFVLTELVSLFRRKSDKKKEILMNLIPIRNQAYVNLFKEICKLEDYFNLFIEEGEFKEYLPVDEFAPLMRITEYNKAVEEIKVFLDLKTIDDVKRFTNTLMIGNHIALTRITAPDMVTEETIVSFVENTLKDIEVLKKDIRVNMGLTKLETMIDKVWWNPCVWFFWLRSMIQAMDKIKKYATFIRANFKITNIRLKFFLETNKIYFELILASFLTIMAIVISFKANEISEKQTLIMDAENKPRFEFKTEQKFNLISRANSDWNLRLFNSGGPITNISYKSMHVLSVKYWNKNNPGVIKNIYIPVQQFYQGSYPTPNSTGEILVEYGSNNISLLSDTFEKVEAYIKQKDFDSVDIGFSQFYKIDYDDYLGREKTEYFNLINNGQVNLSLSDGSIIENMCDEKIKSGQVIYLMNLDNINIEKVFNGL